MRTRPGGPVKMSENISGGRLDRTTVTQLRRRQPAAAVYKPAAPVAWGEPLEALIRERFFELLDAGQWWGASVFSDGASDSRELLERLAHSGARCALLGARADAVGYLAAVAHPFDAARWPARVVSPALGLGRRPPGEASKIVFFRLGRSDFPAQVGADSQQPPRVYEDNSHAATRTSLALAELDVLAGFTGDADRKGSRRL